MASKKALASNQQLYVLNRAGMLVLRDDPGEPIRSHDADGAIKASIVKQGRQGKQTTPGIRGLPGGLSSRAGSASAGGEQLEG